MSIFLVVMVGCALFLQLDRPGPRMPQGVRSIDLCPANTIYFTVTPSIYRLYTRFLRDHNASLASALVNEATLYYGRTRLDVTGAFVPMPPRYDDVNAALAETAPDEVFFALVAPREAGAPLDFISGGRTLGADATGLAFRELLAARVRGLRWDEQAQGPFKIHVGSAPDFPALYFLPWDRWLLCASRLDILHDLIARNAQGDSLATSPNFTRSLRSNGFTDQSCLFLIYTDVLRCRSLLARGPSDANRRLARRLSETTPWLASVSWSWHVDPARNTGADRLYFGLVPPASDFVQSWPLLGSRTRSFVQGATVVYAPFTLSQRDIAKMPVAASIARLGLENEVEAAFVVDVPADGPPRTCQVLAVEGASTRFSSLQPADGMYFSTTGDFLIVAPDPASARYFAGGNRGGAPRFERFPDEMTSQGGLIGSVYYDTESIARRYAALATRDWDRLRPALARRGMDLPATPPDLDVSTLYRGARLDVRVAYGGLLVDNVIRRGDYTSTYFSAATALASQAYGPEIQALLERVYAATALPAADATGSGFNATKFVADDLLGTYILFVPSLQLARGMTVIAPIETFIYISALRGAVPEGEQ